MIKKTNARVAIFREPMPLRCLLTIFTLMPYMKVATKISVEKEIFLKSIFPLPVKSKISPAIPIITPAIFLFAAFSSKNQTPIMIVKIVVSAFRIPARELSILVSARQNK